jgi:hypothetical protein
MQFNIIIVLYKLQGTIHTKSIKKVASIATQLCLAHGLLISFTDVIPVCDIVN